MIDRHARQSGREEGDMSERRHPTSRATARRRATGDDRRRGATIVLVTVLMVPLLGMGALALDLGWWQVGATEVQNAADAAALAGARALQVDPTNAATKVSQYAQDAGEVNKAFGTVVDVLPADIEPIFYTPSSNTIAVQGDWTTANAVRVTVRKSAPMIFGKVSGMITPPTIVRSAVAWIANINNGTCIKPWALPYQSLYDRVAAITGIGASTASPRPNLTQTQMTELGETGSDADRLIIFRPPTYDGLGGNPDSTQALGSLGFNNGMFTAYNFTSPTGNNNASGTTYQANISGCSTQTVAVSTTNGATLPGSNDIPCLTVNAIMGSNANQCGNGPTNGNSTPWPWSANINQAVTCYYAPLTTAIADAGCYSSSQTVTNNLGVMENVAWGDNVGNGSNATTYRLIGKIKVVCVFRGVVGIAGVTNEVCPVGNGTLPANYPRGTIVGVIQGLSMPVINGSTQLGNVTSDQQRLILVR